MVGGKVRRGLAAVAFLLAGGLGAAAPAQVATKISRIVDPETQCATSNPFPVDGETIRWNGACRDGLLEGPGVLTWFRNGRVHERDEGTFRRGELHGDATITFADGSTIFGNYTDGRRNGEFVIVRADNSYVRAVYQMDRLVSERELSRREVRALLEQRRAGVGVRVGGGPGAEPAAPPQPQYAPTPQPPAYPPAYPPSHPPQAYAPMPPMPAPQTPAVQPMPLPAAPHHAGPMQPPPWSPMANAQRLGVMPQSQPMQPVPMAPPSPAVGYRPMAYAMPASAPPAPMADTDSHFVHAFALERAGQYQQAAQVYQAIAMASPGTSAGNLAYERMALLGAYMPPPPISSAVPAAFQPPPAPVARQASMAGRRVCSARGLYPNDGRWCGVVREQDGAEVLVEVAEVKTNAFFTIGFAASECTGGRFLTWFSRGANVWVPASCMR
ncbi:MAG: hypothetical protein KIT20_08945 [Alphaproteobacteria bacterium]|nr:hypothetical protein [Alphaproteobacteria bacterium]